MTAHCCTWGPPSHPVVMVLSSHLGPLFSLPWTCLTWMLSERGMICCILVSGGAAAGGQHLLSPRMGSTELNGPDAEMSALVMNVGSSVHFLCSKVTFYSPKGLVEVQLMTGETLYSSFNFHLSSPHPSDVPNNSFFCIYFPDTLPDVIDKTR